MLRCILGYFMIPQNEILRTGIRRSGISSNWDWTVTVCYQFYTVSTGFQYVSESSSRSLCSCGSVSMVLLLHICRNSVSRSKTSEGVHGYGLYLLDVFSYRVRGRQRDSEVLRSMGHQFGTVCHQLCETAAESVVQRAELLIYYDEYTNHDKRVIKTVKLVLINKTGK